MPELLEHVRLRLDPLKDAAGSRPTDLICTCTFRSCTCMFRTCPFDDVTCYEHLIM